MASARHCLSLSLSIHSNASGPSGPQATILRVILLVPDHYGQVQRVLSCSPAVLGWLQELPGARPDLELECIPKLVIIVSDCIPGFGSVCPMRIPTSKCVYHMCIPTFSSFIVPGAQFSAQYPVCIPKTKSVYPALMRIRSNSRSVPGTLDLDLAGPHELALQEREWVWGGVSLQHCRVKVSINISVCVHRAMCCAALKNDNPPPPNPYISEMAFSCRFQKVYTYPPPPPQVTTCLHVEAKVAETTEKCQNPQSWQVMNVPERSASHSRGCHTLNAPTLVAEQHKFFWHVPNLLGHGSGGNAPQALMRLTAILG